MSEKDCVEKVIEDLRNDKNWKFTKCLHDGTATITNLECEICNNPATHIYYCKNGIEKHLCGICLREANKKHTKYLEERKVK